MYRGPEAVAGLRFRGRALQRFRTREGLTRQELAARAGMRSGDRIGSWERGVDQVRQPSGYPRARHGDALLDALDVLGVSTAQLRRAVERSRAC